jgi:hypothetical protein
MPLTKCTTDTAVIADLGTTPDERGLTTEEFKAKFDEASTGLKTYINDTLIPEIEAQSGLIGNNPAVRVTHSTNQSISSGTINILAFNSERYDTHNMHDNATNNSRLTCKVAGKYIATANVRFAANAAGDRIVGIRLNSASAHALMRVSATAGGAETTVSVISPPLDLSVNDYLEVYVVQYSGVTLDVTKISDYSPEFSMIKVG